MKPTYKMNRSGFTLIEILVVIGIIALLAAILFPVLSRARENARRTTCLSNLQQLGLAFQQYTADYGRRYPGAGQYQRWGNGGHWIAGPDGINVSSNSEKLADDNSPYTATGKSADLQDGALYRYVRSEAVYRCPSAENGDEKKLTYSMNCAIAGMNDVRLRTPSEIVLLVDEPHNNDGFFYTETNNSTDTITDIHNGAGNILFTDGHVKSYTQGQYPLVNSQSNDAAKALKTRTTGTPRFYDRAFGTAGYYTAATAFGSCIAPAP